MKNNIMLTLNKKIIIGFFVFLVCITTGIIFTLNITNSNTISDTIKLNDLLPGEQIYVIGEHVFTDNNTYLSINIIMLAARTIDLPENLNFEESLKHMVVYARDLEGNWINTFTGEEVDYKIIPSNIKYVDFDDDVLSSIIDFRDVLKWEDNTQIHDITGDLQTASVSNSRVLMSSYIQVQPGDTIKLNSNKHKFIIYGYSDANGSYSQNQYIDTNPEDSTSALKNWGTEFTFEEDMTYGNGQKINYPLYVRLTVRTSDVTNGTLTSEDVKDLFEFDIAADNSHLVVGNLDSTPSTSLYPNNLVWQNNKQIQDNNGMISNASINNTRVLMSSYIQVQPGDTIKLNSNKHKFIIYGYSDANGTYSQDQYIDTNPEDSTSALKNWGTEFTFEEDMTYGNGQKINYPLYVRITVRTSDVTNGTLTSEEVKDLFEFHVAADNSHLNKTMTKITPVSSFNSLNLIAHRGLSGVAPENTFAALDAAKNSGMVAVEIDIQMTKDNVPVLLHDPSINRTSNGTGTISSLTFEQVRQYDFGTWKSSQYAGEVIPSLREALTYCNTHNLICELDLANRNFTNEQIAIIYETVAEAGALHRTMFTATTNELLKYIKIDKNIIVSVSGITSTSVAQSTLPRFEDCLMVFASVPVDNMSEELITYIHSLDMKAKVWTINSSNTLKLQNAKKWNVDLILTDDLTSLS